MPRRSAAAVAESRSAIVRAAVDVAAVEGLEGLTIGRLADQLEMSKSGLFGRFGSKQQLQLATLKAASEVFVEEVWTPAANAPAGRARLLAICDAWLSYLRREVFPGGCFLASASTEFDARPGPVRDAIAAAASQWLGSLQRELAVATAAGELPAGLDAGDAAFELNALANGANSAFQLHRDPAVFDRAHRAMHRLLRAAPDVWR